MSSSLIPFKELAHRNLASAQLRENLRKATGHSAQLRKEVVADVPDWEQLRSRAHAIKKEAIDHLADYLQEFAASAAQAGCHVFWAETAAQAVAYVADVCQKHGASLAVKAKSMTSEEIELNSGLLKEGINPVETDLGEYIIQLAGERPSHITGPALHKSRTEIGQLFSEKLGIPFTDNPEKLTQVARRTLREKFLNAPVGITGVNFGIAESGTIVLITNEGNGRMCTTLPSTQIAIMGIEKVIPRFDDLRVFLKLLARSSTGQRFTSYMSMITGPRRSGEPDGPSELHIILLDNGRTEMLSHPHTREALFCIRCGACLNSCPVYQRVGGHTYGWVYPGPIGSVLTPEFLGLGPARQLPYASSLCGSCAEVCPVKIDIHHQLLWLRKSVVDSSLSPGRERLLMRLFLTAMKNPRFYRWSGAMGRALQSMLGRRQKGLRVPGWSLTRDFPPLARKTFHELWKDKQVQ